MPNPAVPPVPVAPLPPLAALAGWPVEDARSARALVSAVLRHAAARGVTLEAPPQEPDQCCGSGCIECVWVAHGTAVGWWRDEALAQLQAQS